MEAGAFIMTLMDKYNELLPTFEEAMGIADDGEKIALFPDGTWFYLDEGVPQWAGDDYEIVTR
jgi:hypothetical protein